MCSVIFTTEDAEMSLGIKPEGIDVTKGHVQAEAYLSVSKIIMKNFPKAKKVITTLYIIIIFLIITLLLKIMVIITGSI